MQQKQKLKTWTSPKHNAAAALLWRPIHHAELHLYNTVKGVEEKEGQDRPDCGCFFRDMYIRRPKFAVVFANLRDLVKFTTK